MNEQRFKELFPRASRATIDANCAIPDAKPQPDQAPALGSAAQGKAQSVERVIVRFTGYRCKPLDPDNFAGGVKDLLDGIRRAKLVQDDSYWQIRLQTEQERVARKSEERTTVEIIYPE